ncbi:MAG: VPS10 domain-containing protein, partial [Flammeovirgaceae bacterium]
MNIRFYLPSALLLLSFLLCIYLEFKKQSAPIVNDSDNEEQFDGPMEFIRFHEAIRTPADRARPEYADGYLVQELLNAEKSLVATKSFARTKSNGVLEWTEHGPANVPGRTRGLIVDPTDAAKNTWYAGSASGGVWRTTNAGQSWTLITPELSNLATTVLAMSDSNPNTIFVGTGEGFSNVDAVQGNGIHKSIDKGSSWSLLPATTSFGNINRITISPATAAVLVAGTETGIYRSVDGGNSWVKVLNRNNILDLRAAPSNFNIQYATERSVGIWKSTDAGASWQLFNLGMTPIGRGEIAIASNNPSKVYVSAEITAFGNDSKLLTTDDGGASWALVDVRLTAAELNFLNGQGWYDNTIIVDPFDQNIVYLGGVDLFRVRVTPNSSVNNFYTADQSGTSSFLNLVNAAFNNNGLINVGSSANQRTVQLRFGPTATQKAHRFTVPAGATANVPATDYTYQNYVDVPFEAWDITGTPRQLMISFRDQNRNGVFDLVPFDNTNTNADLQSREYIYINNVDYAAVISNSIAQQGGQVFNEMYSIWPSRVGDVFPPANAGNLTFRFISQPRFNATTEFITDGRGQYGNPGKNSNVHVDHHNLVAIQMSPSTYRLLNGNDGGVALSNTSSQPGINNGDWQSVGQSYNTSQFYGADKRPGRLEFIGGTQ